MLRDLYKSPGFRDRTMEIGLFAGIYNKTFLAGEIFKGIPEASCYYACILKDMFSICKGIFKCHNFLAGGFNFD